MPSSARTLIRRGSPPAEDGVIAARKFEARVHLKERGKAIWWPAMDASSLSLRA